MKKLFLILFAAAVGFNFTTSETALDGITNAIGSGDAEKLATYFDSSLELAVMNQEDVFDKAKAKSLIARFFSAHPPKGFKQMHHGESNGSEYVIGNLTTANGTFRVYLYVKGSGSAVKIQELRFDEE